MQFTYNHKIKILSITYNTFAHI